MRLYLSLSPSRRVRSPCPMPRVSGLSLQAEGIGQAGRCQQGESAVLDDGAAQRVRRLRRKRLAEKAVAHWKTFAREGIADARARAHASTAPQRRILTRWRAGAAALRLSRLRRTADAGRRRFLAESRGFATWLAVTRAARDRRRRFEETVAAAKVSVGAPRRVSRELRSWLEWASTRQARREAGRAAGAHWARSLATASFRRWRGTASLASDRRGMEAAAIRAWASGRLYSGLAGLRRNALKHRLDAFLLGRGLAARRRLLGMRGLGALEAALLRAAWRKDVVAEAEAGRARAGLARWGRRASVMRARRAVVAEQAFVHASSLLPGKLRRGIQRWRQYCTSRQHFRRTLTDVATVSRPPVSVNEERGEVAAPSPKPIPAPSSRAAVTVGRVQVTVSLRQWRVAASRRRRARASAGLAQHFREHVLLLRHHEHWKAFVGRRRAATELVAAAGRLGRRARARRALLGLRRASEESALQRERVRPRLREAFLAWDGVCSDGLRKREGREQESRERDRRIKRRVIGAWLRRTQGSVAERSSFVEGERQHRRRCLGEAVQGWAKAGLELRCRKEKMAGAREHADRRRLATGMRVWRAAAACITLRRSANMFARDKSAKSLAGRTLRAWRERADLQAARKAVFRARVASATKTVAEGKLRRALARWQEVHRSARVVKITRLRAEGHARRKALGKFWGTWVEVLDLQRRRNTFRAKAAARRQHSLQRQAFYALASAADAARMERERVSAALLLWKLHTQGKAFTALAAHRLRRLWKQDRARRAVGWRRERLIKHGALRWAATADALSASRISSAAFREGNKATRRWEAAGRCARHWRRVAAARVMERRARDQPRSKVMALPRGSGGSLCNTAVGTENVKRGSIRVGDGEAGVVTEAGHGVVSRRIGAGVGRCRGGRGVYTQADTQSRLLGVAATATAPTSCFRGGSSARGFRKENNDGNAAEQAEALLFSSHQRNEAVSQAARITTTTATNVSALSQPGLGSKAYRNRNGSTELSAVYPGYFEARPKVPAVEASRLSGRAGALPERWLSASAFGPQDVLGTRPLHTSEGGTADENRLPTVGDRVPVAPGRAVLEGAFALKSGSTASKETGGSSLLSSRDGQEEGGEGRGHSPSPKTITISDVTQAVYLSRLPPIPAPAPELSCGRDSSGILDVDDGGVRRRRPAPRRPLELLLDETSRYAAITTDGGRRGGGGGGGGGAPPPPPPPPLSTWVVDEMNRLFGVRHANTSLAAAKGGSGVVSAGDQGCRERGAVLQSSKPADLGETRQTIDGRDGSGGRRAIVDPSRDGSSSSCAIEYERCCGADGPAVSDKAAVQREGSAQFKSAVDPPSFGQWSRSGSFRSDFRDQHGQHANYASSKPQNLVPLQQTGMPFQESSRRPQLPLPPPHEVLPAADGGGSGEGHGALNAARLSWFSSPCAYHHADPPPSPHHGPRGGESTPSSTEIEVAVYGKPSANSLATRRTTTAAAAGAKQDSIRVGPTLRVGQGASNSRVAMEDLDSNAAATSRPQTTRALACSPQEFGTVDVATISLVTPQQSPTPALSLSAVSTSTPQEADLEARVAKAERRLLALQAHVRQRRKDKRELAALHQALADQKRKTTNTCRGVGGGSGGRGDDDADFGGVAGVDDGCGDGLNEKEAPRRLHLVARDSSGSKEVGGGLPQTALGTQFVVEAGGGLGASSASTSTPQVSGGVAAGETVLPPHGSEQSITAPIPSDTSSRRALLVRMGLVRARLDVGGRVRGEGGRLRPVAESLCHEVEQLAKSCAVGGSMSERGCV